MLYNFKTKNKSVVDYVALVRQWQSK